jgi:hypothetical protein
LARKFALAYLFLYRVIIKIEFRLGKKVVKKERSSKKDKKARGMRRRVRGGQARGRRNMVKAKAN